MQDLFLFNTTQQHPSRSRYFPVLVVSTVPVTTILLVISPSSLSKALIPTKGSKSSPISIFESFTPHKVGR